MDGSTTLKKTHLQRSMTATLKVAQRPQSGPSCVYLNFANVISAYSSHSRQGPGPGLHSLPPTTHTSHVSPASGMRPSLLVENHRTGTAKDL